MRSIGLDIHRDFMEVAIAEGSEIRSLPRVEMSPEALQPFAQSLGADDQAALEVSGNAWEVVRIIRPHVARIVAASPTDTGMRQARAKTDRLDARALARLLAQGQLDGVWVPDEATEAMRRRLQRRRQLIVTRSKAKNEIHGALMRRLELVGYLGLDPIVRQSGSSQAAHGRISKQGSAAGRYALIEAAWSVVRTPGPLRAFYERTRVRRGAQVAIVATARKLACLFWCLLVRGEDYAYGQPSLLKRKLRTLELRAGQPKRSTRGEGIWRANEAVRKAEHELAARAEAAYKRTVADWQRNQARRKAKRREEKEGAGATPGRAS